MEYLYINDQYCANPEELKTLLTDPGNQKSKQFRNEVLAFFRDGILGKWCEQHGIAMQYSDKNDTDDKAFKEIVKAITGNEVSGNLSSKFNEIGEFLRAEIEGKSYTITDGKIDVVLDKETTSSPIKFVFKCLKPENNEYSFTLRDQTVSQNWKNFNKGEEVVYEFSAKKIGNYRLNEGNNNQICELILGIHPFSYYAELFTKGQQFFCESEEKIGSVNIKFRILNQGPDKTIELNNEKQTLRLEGITQQISFSPKKFGKFELKCGNELIGYIEIKKKEKTEQTNNYQNNNRNKNAIFNWLGFGKNTPQPSSPDNNNNYVYCARCGESHSPAQVKNGYLTCVVCGHTARPQKSKTQQPKAINSSNYHSSNNNTNGEVYCARCGESHSSKQVKNGYLTCVVCGYITKI